jgi:hypothetical protein
MFCNEHHAVKKVTANQKYNSKKDLKKLSKVQY